MFYETVEEALEENKRYYSKVMGDWNSKIGKGKEVQGVLGPHGIGLRNEGVERLLEFATRNNLKVTRSFFKTTENS